MLVYPTHRTTTLVLGNSSATSDARTRYDLSSLLILMRNLRALYARSVFLRAHELVGLTYPSHLSLTSLAVTIDGAERDCLLATSGLGRLRNLRKLEIVVGSGSDDWSNLGRDFFQNLAGLRLDGLEHLRFILRSAENALVLSWLSRWTFPRLRTCGIRMHGMLVTDLNLPGMATAIQVFMNAHRSITDLFFSAPTELTALVLRMDTSASTVHLSDPPQFLPALASSTRTLVCTCKAENTPVMDFLDLLLSPGACERLRALQCLKLCVWHHLEAGSVRLSTRRFAWKDMADASRGLEFFRFLRYAERLQEHGVELLDDDGFGPPLISESTRIHRRACITKSTSTAFPQSKHSQSIMITTT
jgi:hypothetical protein